MILNVSVSEAGKAASVRLETTSALNSTAVNMANVLMFYQPSRMGESAIIHVIEERFSWSFYMTVPGLSACLTKACSKIWNCLPIIKAFLFLPIFSL